MLAKIINNSDTIIFSISLVGLISFYLQFLADYQKKNNSVKNNFFIPFFFYFYLFKNHDNKDNKILFWGSTVLIITLLISGWFIIKDTSFYIKFFKTEEKILM